jgi:hypothetical protein
MKRDACADHGASDFLACFEAPKAQVIVDQNHLFHENERAVGVDDLQEGRLGKRQAGNLCAGNDDADGQE